MEKNSAVSQASSLRVLVVHGGPAGGIAIAGWLRGHAAFEVEGPTDSISAAITMAATFRPEVVLLDFHGLPVSVSYAVTLFKEFTPQPLVFVLTHDASNAMRRRAHDAQVDAVFDKTSELDALVSRLMAVRFGVDCGPESKIHSCDGVLSA